MESLYCSSFWSEKEPLREETDIVRLYGRFGVGSLRCEKVVEAHDTYEWKILLENFYISSIFSF
jgi:hypothetical protein